MVGVFQKENNEWGVKRELECLPFIKEVLGEDVKHHTDTFNEFDFSTNKYNIELKSRTISSKCFNTTFTTPTKRMKARKSSKSVLWLFSFTDGLYYLIYKEHKELIDGLKPDVYMTRYGERQNINIPLDILKPFNKSFSK